MATIEEIPLDNADNQENIPDNGQDIQESAPEIPEETISGNNPETPTAKKKGRPPGAKNKPKPKPPAPKAPPKAKPRPKKPVVEEEYESSEEEPRRPEIDRNQLAAEVLGLLQQQRHNQATARRNHYASWFQNMR